MRSAIFVLAAAAALPAAAQVGVSISVGQPGFYGQIELGDAPPPAVVYAQPTVIAPPPAVVGPPPPPIYLRVPPGYARHWGRHCAEYNACGRPVYFVQDSWYNNVYVPHYREHPEHFGRHDDQYDWHGHGHGYGHEHDHGDHDHDHHDHDHDR